MHPQPLSPPSALALALLALMAGGPHAALAQAEQRVEIVGASPLPGLELPLDRVAGNVQKLPLGALESSADLASAINRRLGSVHFNEIQGNAFQPDLNFRGFTASPLLGTAQGLSVYVDGMRLNQPFGDTVSWELIPKSAIADMALMPGSNPLFGLNTLGGALSVRTKDGVSDPGIAGQLLAGAFGRTALEFQAGGGSGALHGFVTGQALHERGWRVNSPSTVSQLFGKLGGRQGELRWALSAALAASRLNGNGMQEAGLLAVDRSSIYTQPDITSNRSGLLNLALSQRLREGLNVSGNVYLRRISSRTYNGDINDDALEEAVYDPNVDERDALTATGFTGLPTVPETAANTPFPKWRCIANALLVDEPGEKCNGVINQSHTRQSQRGFGLQLDGRGQWGSLAHQFVVGMAYDASQAHFTQGSELGYLAPDRSIVGVGAFGDGVSGGVVDGEPFDTRVDLGARTRIWSGFASDTLQLAPRTYLTLSGRYNRVAVRNRDAIIPGAGPGSLDSDQRFARFNPALGLTSDLRPGLNAYVGVNQGSRAPSAIELGCADPDNPCKLPNAMAGDPPLAQVVTTTFEAGLRGLNGPLRWNLSLFRADNRDDILFVADNAAGFGYFRNFGRTRRQGLEAGVTARVGSATLGFNYTWLDATFRSAERVNGGSNSSNDAALGGFPGVEGSIAIASGDRLPLVPRQMAKFFVEMPLATGLQLGLDIAAVGSSIARGNENNRHQSDGQFYLGEGRNPGYAVMNLDASWKLKPGLTLFAKVDNLLDRDYSTAAQLGPAGFDTNGNFVARPFAADANGDQPLRHSTFYAPGAPRTWWVGLRMTLGD